MTSDHRKTIKWIRRGEVLGVSIKKLASDLDSVRQGLTRIGRSLGQLLHYPRQRA